jgi:hypothetical protein
VAALEAGDLDDVDRIASWLGGAATAQELRSLLAAPVASSLAAAGHASILLYLLPRVSPARGTLLRAAARAMLVADPDHAPYGWSHCLTMPQAVMGLAGDAITARSAVAIAATYVVGFRAALGQVDLVPDHETDAPGIDVADLATAASLHHDAHLVKHTLACLDAAAYDPTHRSLYLAAAARLVAWWQDVEPSDGLFD